MTNHYDYLERVLPDFFEVVGLDWDLHSGIIVAHGDKCSQYRRRIEDAGMTFEQGVAIYLLTYCTPYTLTCRDTPNGWVAPIDWIIKNKDIFLPLLPEE